MRGLLEEPADGLSNITNLITAGSNITITGNGTLGSPYVINATGGGSGATTALDNLASVAINASLVLATSDAFALGSTTKQWSDLFLALGGVINWDNGDLIITHSSNLLTLAGGMLYLSDLNQDSFQLRVGNFVIQPYNAFNGFMTNNLYYNNASTGWTYVGTGVGSGFHFDQGQVMFIHAISGTAGTSASPVYAMKSDSSGNVAIGGNINTALGNFTGSMLNVLGAGGIVAKTSLTLPYVAKTANYTATISDYTIDCTSGTFTITLPTASGITGRIYVIKNSGTGVITVDANSTETIDGALTQTLSTQYASITIQSNGANWIVI